MTLSESERIEASDVCGPLLPCDGESVVMVMCVCCGVQGPLAWPSHSSLAWLTSHPAALTVRLLSSLLSSQQAAGLARSQQVSFTPLLLLSS